MILLDSPVLGIVEIASVIILMANKFQNQNLTISGPSYFPLIEQAADQLLLKTDLDKWK